MPGAKFFGEYWFINLNDCKLILLLKSFRGIVKLDVRCICK